MCSAKRPIENVATFPAMHFRNVQERTSLPPIAWLRSHTAVMSVTAPQLKVCNPHDATWKRTAGEPAKVALT